MSESFAKVAGLIFAAAIGFFVGAAVAGRVHLDTMGVISGSVLVICYGGSIAWREIAKK